MDQADLYELWQAPARRDQQNKDRPAFVREYREALAEHVDTDEALPPPDASIARYSHWLDAYKATVTRQLNPENGETDTTDPSEGGA